MNFGSIRMISPETKASTMNWVAASISSGLEPYTSISACTNSIDGILLPSSGPKHAVQFALATALFARLNNLT